ncbi:MAG: T9SS type A sorting domain-containing protein [Bacteroidales bacterium]|nr:T9SS type A sorting domain-containing protein [Bacteroidales bacterium]
MKKSEVFLILIMLFSGVGNGVFAQNQLTGTVNYNGNDTLPIPEVTLGLYDMDDELVVSTETDDDGVYLFDNVPSGEYYLRSSVNYEPELVDIQDSYLVLMYLMNMYELDDIQYEAADIDNSGSVTWFDYFYIVTNYLLYGEPFPAGVWQFEEAYVDFTSRVEPDTTNLWGITEGDVDGYWEPSGRDLKILNYTHYPVQLMGNEIKVKIKSSAKEQLAGFSINLAYPVSQLNIIDVVGPDKNLKYVLDEEKGLIRIVWMDEYNTGRINGDHLVSLVIETKSTEIERAAFELMPGSMLIDTKGGEIGDVEILLPMLEKNNAVELNVTTYPNPVVDRLNVQLNLNETNYGSVSIFDVSGKLVVKSDNISLSEGEQLISVDTQSLNPGSYFYVVELLGNTPFKASGQIVKSQ